MVINFTISPLLPSFLSAFSSFLEEFPRILAYYVKLFPLYFFCGKSLANKLQFFADCTFLLSFLVPSFLQLRFIPFSCCQYCIHKLWKNSDIFLSKPSFFSAWRVCLLVKDLLHLLCTPFFPFSFIFCTNLWYFLELMLSDVLTPKIRRIACKLFCREKLAIFEFEEMIVQMQKNRKESAKVSLT